MDTIAAIKKSDKLAFDEAYFVYHKRIYFYILRKTHSPYLAEEVTQVTFIKLWQYREKLSLEYSLFTQIFRIARTSMIDILRKEKALQVSAGNGDHNLIRHTDVWDEITGKELSQSVDKLIRNMPAMRRKVFEMNRFQGMTYKEIAEELSLSVKTIESHMTQAIRQLKKYMGLVSCCFLLLCKFFF